MTSILSSVIHSEIDKNTRVNPKEDKKSKLFSIGFLGLCGGERKFSSAFFFAIFDETPFLIKSNVKNYETKKKQTLYSICLLILSKYWMIIVWF